MDQDDEREKSAERRAVLKNLGVSPLALLFADGARGAVDEHLEIGSGTTPAQTHQGRDVTQGLDVYKVEPGWRRADGSWDPAGGAVDTEFDATMHVDGVEPSGNTSLAYMVALVKPGEGFPAVHGGKAVNPPSGGKAQITHGSPVTRGFQPETGTGNWSKGTYRIYALVVDRARNAYGGGASPPFEIT